MTGDAQDGQQYVEETVPVEPSEADPAAPATPPETFRYATVAPWLLSGPARSPNLDVGVRLAITIGLQAVNVAPGAYRLLGDLERMAKMQEWLRKYKPSGPIVLGLEPAPAVPKLTFRVTPVRTPPRVAEIHGADRIDQLVVRAVDAGLQIRCVGLGRFSVTGETWKHVEWMRDVLQIDRRTALEKMALTEESAAAEDAALVPPLTINLPPRKTVADITRDPRTGDITGIVQLEKNA